MTFPWPEIYIIHLIVMSLALLSSYLQLLSTSQDLAAVSDDGEPRFLAPIPNLTIAVGRDAQLACHVSGLGPYKAAWLRVEDKGILTIHQHVISRNYRLSLITNENRSFVLVIKNVQESDRGGYMCQINTTPMLSQVGYLDVLVPPSFAQTDQSWDKIVPEGSNVTLTCYTRGHPLPNVRWRREDNGEIIFQENHKKYSVRSVVGESLTITRVTRVHMGVYLCIASNGVPPAISRRIQLHVNFSPVVWIASKMHKGQLGGRVTLNCHIEAFPRAEKYWTKGDEKIKLTDSLKYSVKSLDKLYKSTYQLTIINLERWDFGEYRCYARNSYGFHEGVIFVNETDSSDELDEYGSDGSRSRDSNSVMGLNSLVHESEDRIANGRKFMEIRSRDKKRGIKEGKRTQLQENSSIRLNPLSLPIIILIFPKLLYSHLVS